MIQVIKEMIRDRGYVPNDGTTESVERMDPYIGQENDLVVLLARKFVDKNPFGANTNILTKKDISYFTLEYYESV